MSTRGASSNDARGRSVACPDCGEHFSPRGLSGHRRLKHGAVPAARPEPSGIGEVLRSLETICGALDRMDSRLQGLEDLRDKAIAATEGAQAERSRLGRELEEVIAQIASVQAEHDGVVGFDQAAAERRKACSERLGGLRRRQVRLLYRLGPLASDADLEAPFESWEMM